MSTIKKNFYTVVKLWINWFAMIFLGTLLTFSFVNSDVLLPLFSGFTVIFFYLLMGLVCLEVGLKDSVLPKSRQSERKWYKCTLLSFVAVLPSLVACIISCISKLFIPSVGFFESAGSATGVAANIYAISTGFNEIVNMMFRGLFVHFHLDNIPFIYLPVILLTVGVCTLAYHLGTRGVGAKLFNKKNLD